MYLQGYSAYSIKSEPIVSNFSMFAIRFINYRHIDLLRPEC